MVKVFNTEHGEWKTFIGCFKYANYIYLWAKSYITASQDIIMVSVNLVVAVSNVGISHVYNNNNFKSLTWVCSLALSLSTIRFFSLSFITSCIKSFRSSFCLMAAFIPPSSSNY